MTFCLVVGCGISPFCFVFFLLFENVCCGSIKRLGKNRVKFGIRLVQAKVIPIKNDKMLLQPVAGLITRGVSSQPLSKVAVPVFQSLL